MFRSQQGLGSRLSGVFDDFPCFIQCAAVESDLPGDRLGVDDDKHIDSRSGWISGSFAYLSSEDYRRKRSCLTQGRARAGMAWRRCLSFFVWCVVFVLSW